MKLTRSKPNWWFALLLPSVLLAGCATRSPDSTPAQPLQAPKLPPSLARPVSPDSYLERAQRSIEEWRKRLTDSETK